VAGEAVDEGARFQGAQKEAILNSKIINLMIDALLTIYKNGNFPEGNYFWRPFTLLDYDLTTRF
jgi:hypothetical protein